MRQTIQDPQVAHHRNGIGGVGFYAVLFKWFDGKATRNMMAVVYHTSDPDCRKEHKQYQGQCSVFDVDELAKGNIGFAQGNSWRGDLFEAELRKAIDTHEAAEDAKWKKAARK